MKKSVYLLFVLISINIAMAVTVRENVTFTPRGGGYNVTYRMNRTFFGLTPVRVNETCLTLNQTIYCNSSATPIIINISEIVDITVPTISNLRNTSTTNQSSYIEWNCDENCNYTIILYNNSAKTSLFDSLRNNTFALSHNPYWNNLTNSTSYYINLTIWDSVGNSVQNNSFNFTTRINVIEEVVEEEVVTPEGKGGAPGLEVSETECKWNITPREIFFSSGNTEMILNITNYGQFDNFIRVSKSKIPTIFGLKNLLEIEREYFYLQDGESLLFDVSITDISNIRENTTVFLIFQSGFRCITNISVHIIKALVIFYDAKVATEHFLYKPEEIVNVIIKIENKGDIPDKDTLLKVYIINPQGEKQYISQEVMFEIDVGITELQREYYLYENSTIGRYVIGVEYETEEQGLLRSESIFFVAPFQRNTIYFGSIYSVFMAIILIIIVFSNKIGKEDK